MQPARPWVAVPGDNQDIIIVNGTKIGPEIMKRSGEFVAWSSTNVLWRFGFHVGSESANVYGVSYSGMGFLWVLANFGGGVIDTWEGIALDLPPHFRSVINS